MTKEDNRAMWMDYGGDEGCLTYGEQSLHNGKKTADGEDVLLNRVIEKSGTEIDGKLVDRFK